MSTRYDPAGGGGDWIQEGSPTSFRAQNMAQRDINADVAIAATQVMLSVGVPLQVGDLVTSISFKSGAQAAVTPTNWWFALYSSAATPALLGQTADQTTTAWAANTLKTVDLATPVRISATGWYYAAIMVKAGTIPTMLGASVALAGASAAILSSKILAQSSGSSLTDTAPATIASPTTVATVPFVVLT